jgi:hypothetical protein
LDFIHSFAADADSGRLTSSLGDPLGHR